MRKNISFLMILGVVFIWFAPYAHAVRSIDWTALNPNLKDATSVGETTDCLECHSDYIKSFEKTRHAKAYRAKFGKDVGSSCEVCHGPLSKHLEEKDESKKAALVVSFKKLDAKQKNQICLQCHEGGYRMHWKGSPHEMNEVSCDKCHYVMNKRSKQAMSIDEDPKKACFQCHKEQRARMQRASHMPMREGKMDCASCHNPHGGTGPTLLKFASVNETCYSCHQEKRGPMIWEHPPVRENCSNCHEPHGSNFDAMLKIKTPFLCQTCHVASFHPSTLYEGKRLPGGSGGAAGQLLGKSCINCHSQIHGSSHPSGARFTR